MAIVPIVGCFGISAGQHSVWGSYFLCTFCAVQGFSSDSSLTFPLALTWSPDQRVRMEVVWFRLGRMAVFGVRAFHQRLALMVPSERLWLIQEELMIVRTLHFMCLSGSEWGGESYGSIKGPNYANMIDVIRWLYYFYFVDDASWVLMFTGISVGRLQAKGLEVLYALVVVLSWWQGIGNLCLVDSSGCFKGCIAWDFFVVILGILFN